MKLERDGGPESQAVMVQKGKVVILMYSPTLLCSLILLRTK